jgi:signal transduction histidine kinase
VRVADGGVREVRETIAAFNRMAGELERLDAEAQRLRGQQALAELGEIGRGLAHSLRNPLHALGLCVEALQAQARAPDEAANLARTAREQIARLDGSLRGFLALSAGVDAPTTEVCLREVIEDVLLEARQSFGPRLAFKADGDLDATLPAVAVELRILLHSLVTNAAEASPDGGRVRITVDAGDVLQITVADEGAGVPESLRPRLFQPHVSSKPQGAGMGLYLAQRLAALRYRGEIALSDRASGGTRASLRLHARQSA